MRWFEIYDRLRGKSSPLYAYGPGLLRNPRGRSKSTTGIYASAGHAARGLQYVIENCPFDTVIDVGSGTGRHAKVFEAQGKTVTKLDYGVSDTFVKGGDQDVILTDINTFETDRTWDLVWASHILEHQPNVQNFIQTLFALTYEGGRVAVTVPPMAKKVVGGHFTIWNQGVLMFNFAMAGFDMREAEVFRYGNNITLIATKRAIELPRLGYGNGDIELMVPYLPDGFFHGMDGSRIEILHHNI